MFNPSLRSLLLPLLIVSPLVTLAPAPGPRVSAAQSGQTLQSSAPQISPADRQSIEQLMKDYAFAWSAHDLDTLASKYTPDASLYKTDTGGARGRSSIQQFLRIEHGGPAANSVATLDVQQIEPIAPGLALVDVRQTITRQGEAAAGRPTDTETSRAVMLLAKQAGDWKIRSERVYLEAASGTEPGVGGAGNEPWDPALERLNPPPQTPPGDFPHPGWNEPSRQPPGSRTPFGTLPKE